MAQLHCNFFSYSLGYGVDIQVILPSLSPCDMDRPQAPTHTLTAKYPVLYLLHGHGNDYLCWSRFTSMERYAEERRIAVVTCSVGNKGYMDASYGEHYFDFVKKELPEFVLANFPISGRPEDTYLAGLSMGGYGTLAHALEHPQSYRAVGAFSPAVDWMNGTTEERIGHDMPKMMDLYQMLSDNLAKGEKLPELFLCIGEGDFLYEAVSRFHQTLEQKGVAHRYDAVAGYEHEWAFWDMELPMFLDWLPRTDAYAGLALHKM